jgi:protein Tex
MDTTISIDLGHIARELNLPIAKVQRTLDLLDEGNTVPFITRYRKDHTGALDEQQIREIQQLALKLRALAERKQTILKSIEAQGRLTPELADVIRGAATTKRLEDLYLPFKPKKQSHATLARQRGLEPLAQQILAAQPDAPPLEEIAAAYVSAENALPATSDVLHGVRYILAEIFNESVDLRDRLRKILWQQGKLVATRLEGSERDPAATRDKVAAARPTVIAEETPTSETETNAPAIDETPAENEAAENEAAESEAAESEAGEHEAAEHDAAENEAAENEAAENVTTENAGAANEGVASESAQTASVTASTGADGTDGAAISEAAASEAAISEAAISEAAISEAAISEAAISEAAISEAAISEAAISEATARTEAAPAVGPPAEPSIAQARRPGRDDRRRQSRSARASKKEKKRQKLESAFKDYFRFSESLTRIPPHRVLAINRGERARILKVRIEWDAEAILGAAERSALSDGHPYRDFLATCLRDALQRLILPSLEREARRELTDFAEQHAVDVFVRNLRKLLLQPPIHGHRLLAVDPGFRNGCKLIAVDEFGNVLGHDIMHVIGRDDRRKEARTKIADIIRRFGLSVVAIGNGTGCRESEQLVADVIGEELRDLDLAYVIVNEAGASVYSTSPIGREELPSYDPVLRSAISIGRRLLDPLSELVKINPANIGVGLYQHDVKAKHLRDSLDAVVESCVNYVGVDANTASPALLRYVSGMNQLTARRFYEYRSQKGPFRTRAEFANVPGFGDATFVQAAGFLQVRDGDNPLDATWIHPESYDIARRVLEKLGAAVDVLRAARATSRPGRSPPLPIADAPIRESARPAADDATASEAPASAAPPEADQAAAKSAAEPLPAPEPSAALSQQPAGPTATAEPPLAVVAEPAGPESAGPESAGPESAGPESAAAGPAAPAERAEQAAPADGSLAETAEAVATTESNGEDSAAAAAEARQAARARLAEKAAQISLSELAHELGVGELLLRDILSALTRPGRDPREDLPPPVFRRGIMKLEDLKPGMELTGTVLNVVDFGAFVDIGLTESGLVHISRLADRYIRDPHEVVGVGDTVKVWVLDIDRERRRVSLTAVPPGAERRRPEPREPRAKAQTPATATAAATGSSGPPRQGGRPQRPKGPPQRGQRQRPAQGRSWTSQGKMPARPLTKEMEEGKEPLRSFGDLLQFYEKKNRPEDSDSATE